MKRMILIVSALVMAPVLAAAQATCPKPVINGACTATADDWYKNGEDQYNLGNFAKAIDAFQKGYELEPSDNKKAAYLFNIAQSYRQDKNCDKAGFFYKRYLAFKDADTVKPLPPAKRQEIEDRIKELAECVRLQEKTATKPPNIDPCKEDPQKCRPDPCKEDPKKCAKPDPCKDDPESCKKPEATTSPRVISARAFGGGAKLTTGSLKVPIQATLAAFAGYPIHVNDMISIDVGAGFTFTPVPFEVMEQGMKVSKSAQLLGVIGNVGATYHATPRIGLRGDLGLGGLVFTGVSQSPFTGGAATSGALTMPHVRVGLSADYAITPNVIATLTPFAFSYSPAKTGLQTIEDGEFKAMTAITAIAFMVGLGYRM